MANQNDPQARQDSGQPGGGVGRKDVTGVPPADVHVDPNVTEGHPGYQESGSSEIIPNQRLTGGGDAGEKKSGG